VAGGAAHGVLLLNSNGMDIVTTETELSYRVTGGVLDFYFFMGPTPNAVLEQLTYIVGRPMMAPYWSMGLMNSKCGLSAMTC
jgi:alpha-glucosidase (family GH31 glycosyl hydrolase)